MHMNSTRTLSLTFVLPLILITLANPASAINSPPEIDLNGPAAGYDISSTYIEDAGDVYLCPNALISDSDTTRMTEMRLVLTPHPDNRNEYLMAAPGGLAVTYSFDMGEMYINGDATVEQYQAVLRSLRYGNTSHTPSSTTRVVTVTIKDGMALSTARTIQIKVTPVNDTPVIDLNGVSSGVNRSLTFTEGGGAVSIAPEGAITDPDGGQLTSMTLALSPRPDGTAESLAATAGGGVSVNYNSSTGVMLLSGTALLTSYETVLRSVTYHNTAVSPDPTTRTLTVKGWDTAGAEGSATAKIKIVQINRAPTGISPTTMSVNENSAMGATIGTFQVLDPNPYDTFTCVQGSTADNNGRFALGNGNKIVVSGALNYEASTSGTIKVTATDNGGLSCTSTIRVMILNVNENPTNVALAAASLNKNSLANEAVAGTLSASDPDKNQQFTYSFVAPNGDCGGRFKIVGNQVRVANAALIKGESQLDYAVSIRVTDQGGLYYSKNFTIHIADSRQPPVIDLNGPGSGVNQAVVFNEGAGALAIAPAATITDGDGTQLTSMTLTLSPRPNGGVENLTATGSGGVSASYNSSTGVMLLSGTAALSSYQTVLRTVKYNNTAAPPDQTTRTLTAVGMDTTGRGGSALAWISVVAINRPPNVDLNGTPSGGNSLVTFTEGGGAVAIAPEARITDPVGDELTSMTIVMNNRPDHNVETLSATATAAGVNVNFNSATGLMLLTGRAKLTNYQTVLRGIKWNNPTTLPDPTTRSLTVRGYDIGGLRGSAGVSIVMKQINRAPTKIAPTTMSIAEKTAVGTVVGTMATTDPNKFDTHTYSFVSPYGNAGGRFSLSGSKLKVTGALDFETLTTATLSIRTTDQGGLGYTATVKVGISNVNEAPNSLGCLMNLINKTMIKTDTLVGTLSASDPDSNQTLTYSFTDPNRDAGGQFKIVGNQLRIANPTQIKADSQTSYLVTIRVADQGGLSMSNTFTIAIPKTTGVKGWTVYR